MIETVNSQQNQRFEYDEKRQQVNDLEMMIADFRRMASDLDQQIKIEQQTAGVSDVNHFAYPTFARAAITRRDNLRSSVAELEKRLDRARQEALEAFEQLKLSEFRRRSRGSAASKAGLAAQDAQASGRSRDRPGLIEVQFIKLCSRRPAASASASVLP